MRCGVFIIETRVLEELPSHIAATMINLPLTWGLTIFHGNSNEKFLRGYFEEQWKDWFHWKVDFVNLEKDILSTSELNGLLTSEDFWEKIPYDKALMIHWDSRMLRKGIEEFLEWDYVGAPWATHEIGGNGGFSIRDKHATIRLIKHLPYQGYEIHDNEDRWISNNLHLVGGKIAPRDVCFKFSCESIFKLGTLGFHAISRYLTKDQCDKIFHQYD